MHEKTNIRKLRGTESNQDEIAESAHWSEHPVGSNTFRSYL